MTFEQWMDKVDSELEVYTVNWRSIADCPTWTSQTSTITTGMRKR